MVSAAGGAPGVTVIVVVLMIPNQRAVMVAVTGLVTALVVTAKAPDADPPGTMASAGTLGLLLKSSTVVGAGSGRPDDGETTHGASIQIRTPALHAARDGGPNGRSGIKVDATLGT